MRRNLVDAALTIVLAIVALLLALNLSAVAGSPLGAVQAAQPADPEVIPCKAINTAAISSDFVITIFRCEPDNAPPYKINSLGFMLNED